MPENRALSDTRPQKRLAVFLDGTWNTQDDNSNVWRLKLMCATKSKDDVPQLSYYDPGVGTRWFDRVSGGAFGRGLDQNIREAYQWLMEHHDEGDEIFVFGFSRGAYTARSLTGLIAKCGLLRPESPLPVVQVYERYARGEEAHPIYGLEHDRRHGRGAPFTKEDEAVLKHSRRVPIKFIGVWDTVGSLGVPVGNLRGVSSKSMGFHFTRLSSIFERCFQALALDEHRAEYRPTLWTKFTPKPAPSTPPAPPPEPSTQIVEQRWFSGAHCNVGGGYRDDPTAQIPLVWMQAKAIEAGLTFRRLASLDGSETGGRLRDSYAEFLKGAYRVWRTASFQGRYLRTIAAEREDKGKGFVDPVNEVVDESVFARWRRDSHYRPQNLIEWAARRGLHLDALADTLPGAN